MNSFFGRGGRGGKQEYFDQQMFMGMNYMMQMQPDQILNEGISNWLNMFKEMNVPQKFHETLIKQTMQNSEGVKKILQAFKVGGRLRKLEHHLKHNNSYLNPEDLFNHQMTKPNTSYRSNKQQSLQPQEKQEEIDYGSEIYKMIRNSTFYRKYSYIHEKKAVDFIQSQNNPNNELMFWGIVIEQQIQFKNETVFIIQNQYKEPISINVIGKSIVKQNQLPAGFNEQTYKQRLDTIQSIQPGDIIGVIHPQKTPDYEAFCTFDVNIDQIIVIKSDRDIQTFMDKYENQQLSSQKQFDEKKAKKAFIEFCNTIQRSLWSWDNFSEIVQILIKLYYFDVVIKFCNYFLNINVQNLKEQQKSEIHKFLFISYIRKNDYNLAFKNFQLANEKGANFDQYKEDIILLLFRMKEFEQVKKMYQSGLDQNQQQKLRVLIEQTNLILDFKSDGKNYIKIIEYINSYQDFGNLVQNFYGPIEIKKASIKLGRDDKDQEIGRGVFLTKDVKSRQLLWAERDMTYPSKGQNNVISMKNNLQERIGDHLLRLRLQYLYRPGSEPDFINKMKVPPLELYSNEKFDYANHGAVPKISDEELFNIIMYSSHTIYPKLFQNDQIKEEQGLWPVFSFVNHSISNRNIEVKVVNGFLFVFSTMAIEKDTQLFHNYILNITDDQKIKETIQKYNITEL